MIVVDIADTRSGVHVSAYTAISNTLGITAMETDADIRSILYELDNASAVAVCTGLTFFAQLQNRRLKRSVYAKALDVWRTGYSELEQENPHAC